MLRSENFFIQLEGKVERLGFYTTRWVKASNSEEAETKAVELIRNDSELRPRILNAKDDAPMIYVKELGEVDEEDVPDVQTGFTFFPAETNA